MDNFGKIFFSFENATETETRAEFCLPVCEAQEVTLRIFSISQMIPFYMPPLVLVLY